MGNVGPQDLVAGHAVGVTTGSRFAVLLSPIFVAALVVLLLNDHWLKAAAVLPGWLTGKLSDFAGLIVAPVLLATLVRARGRHAWLCTLTVAAGFCAVNLWPPAARGVEHVMRQVGLSWRIWSDPTDLIALAVLPITWRVLRSSTAARPPERSSWWLERLTAMIAMLACVATSEAYFPIKTSIVVLSTAHHEVELQLFRPSQPLDCRAVVADPRATLVADHFTFESCQKLKPLNPVPLDFDWSSDEDGEGKRVPPPDSARACDAVLLRAPGLDDTVVFWNDVPKVEIDRYDVPHEHAHVVYLEPVGDRLFVHRPSVAQTWVSSFSPPAANCEAESP